MVRSQRRQPAEHGPDRRSDHPPVSMGCPVLCRLGELRICGLPGRRRRARGAGRGAGLSGSRYRARAQEARMPSSSTCEPCGTRASRHSSPPDRPVTGGKRHRPWVTGPLLGHRKGLEARAVSPCCTDWFAGGAWSGPRPLIRFLLIEENTGGLTVHAIGSAPRTLSTARGRSETDLQIFSPRVPWRAVSTARRALAAGAARCTTRRRRVGPVSGSAWPGLTKWRRSSVRSSRTPPAGLPDPRGV